MKLTEKKKDKNKLSVKIEEDLSIYSVKEVKNRLADYFSNIRDIEFDLSAVDKVDTAGFQLLSIIRKEVESKNRSFSIVKPSGEIKRIFALYGEEL